MNIDKSTPENDDDSWWDMCDGERRSTHSKTPKNPKTPTQALSKKTLYHNRNWETVLISKNGRQIGSAELSEVFSAVRQNDGLAMIGGHAVPYSEVEKIKSCSNARGVLSEMRDRNDRNRALATIHKNCFY